jgi:hypothetical protein
MLHNIRKRKERVKKNVDATKKKLLKKSKKSRMELTRTEVKISVFNLLFLTSMKTHCI